MQIKQFITITITTATATATATTTTTTTSRIPQGFAFLCKLSYSFNPHRD